MEPTTKLILVPDGRYETVIFEALVHARGKNVISITPEVRTKHTFGIIREGRVEGVLSNIYNCPSNYYIDVLNKLLGLLDSMFQNCRDFTRFPFTIVFHNGVIRNYDLALAYYYNPKCNMILVSYNSKKPKDTVPKLISALARHLVVSSDFLRKKVTGSEQVMYNMLYMAIGTL